MKKIDEIIAKYLEGESSLEEEKQIREFLSTDDLPKEYLYLKDQFEYFENAGNEKSKLNTDELILTEKEPAKILKLSEMQRFMIRISGAAATLIIMIVAFFMFVVEDDKYPNDTIKDPQLAYEEVQSALGLIAENMNKGTNKLNKLSIIQTSLEKAGRVSEFNKNLMKANKITDFNRISNKYVSHVLGV